MPGGQLFTYFYTKEQPELTHGVAIVPNISSTIFAPRSSRKSNGKKGGKHSPLSGTERNPTSVLGARRMSTIPTHPHATKSTRSPEKEKKPKILTQKPTHTSQMLAQMIKLNCRVNGETGARTIAIPDSITTMDALLSRIQNAMKLSAKMKFAKDLFLPDGTKLTTMEAVAAAAIALTTVTVGSGEAFDEFSIEPTMAVLNAQGGGRAAPLVAKRQLSDKDRKAAHLKAQHIRNAGHGMAPLTPAVKEARKQKQEHKHVVALQTREEGQLLKAMREEERGASELPYSVFTSSMGCRVGLSSRRSFPAAPHEVPSHFDSRCSSRVLRFDAV
uniref:Uncharacterized protein n=1 Tax=Haptolina ericina TaxID=156174 RepID=A0A6T9LR71_9EUKA